MTISFIEPDMGKYEKISGSDIKIEYPEYYPGTVKAMAPALD